MRYSIAALFPAGKRGFTVIELVVVITTLGVLIAIVSGSAVGYQSTARDKERGADILVISQNIERYYRTTAVATGATYPAGSTTPAIFASLINNEDAVIAPQATTNSIVIATNADAQTPTFTQYIYQPLNVDGTFCSNAPCVRYKLHYRLESNNTVMTRDSMRQQ